MNILSSTVFFRHLVDKDCLEAPERLGRLPKKWFKKEDIEGYVRYENLPGYAHEDSYVEYIKKRCGYIKPGKSVPILPKELTFLSRDTYKVACFAVGYAVGALIASINNQPTFAVVRPPGHHAERAYGKGFCIFNNMAVAALYAVEEYRKRIMSVDFDIHRGDGTQEITAGIEKVCHVSINQKGIYPDDEPPFTRTKAANITNINLPRGASENDCLEDILERLRKITDKFNPDVIGFSAGFDSCYLDRGWILTSDFRMGERYFRSLREFAENRNIPYFAVLEGGYNPESVLFGIGAFTGV